MVYFCNVCVHKLKTFFVSLVKVLCSKPNYKENLLFYYSFGINGVYKNRSAQVYLLNYHSALHIS